MGRLRAKVAQLYGQAMTDHIPTPPLTLWLRRLPILAIAVGAVLGLVYFRHYLNFETLGQHRAWLLEVRDTHYVLMSLAFIAVYTGVVITSVPGALILTMAGGFLFGLFPGVIYNVFAATLGAVTVFAAAKAGFGRDFARRIEARGGAVARLQASLKQNQIWVLLAMRLIPVMPFFISNIVPAFVGIRFWTFAITTFVGIIPADVIYTALGAGLGEVFARGEVPSLHTLVRPEFGLPLIGLGLLALLPLVVKLFQRKKG
jgi:uncharacterized membrane protein YdjX (TVP38/TMEM64 family)